MSVRTFIALLAILSLAIASCTEAPTGTSVDNSMSKTTGTATSAAPAIAYLDTVTTKSKGVTSVFGAIKVMDADGANETAVYKGAADSYTPTKLSLAAGAWAPGGTGTQTSPWRLAFTEQSGTGWSLRTLSVYLNTGGAPVGTAPVTIASATSENVRPAGPVWSSSRSELAYAITSNAGGVHASTAWLVTLSGTKTCVYPASGTPSPDLTIYDVAFSPTGDTIVLAIMDDQGDAANGNDETSIVLVDRSGTVLTTIVASATPWFRIDGIDFNRDGDLTVSAKVVLAVDANGNTTSVSAFEIYTIDLSSGTISKRFAGALPTWSPDASTVAFKLNAGISSRTIGGSTSTTLTTSGTRPAWRR